jgi:hypothetical protein
MLVRIDMVEVQAGRSKGLELRGDLFLDLPADGVVDHDLRAEAAKVAAQPPAGVNEIWDLRAMENRVAVDENEMKSDPQVRQPLRPRHRIGGGRPADHQTCGAEHSLAVRGLHRFIDFVTEPEIVGIDD